MFIYLINVIYLWLFYKLYQSIWFLQVENGTVVTANIEVTTNPSNVHPLFPVRRPTTLTTIMAAITNRIANWIRG